MKKVHTYVLCIMSQLINKIHFRISKDHFLVKYANLQSGMKTFDLVHQRNKNKKMRQSWMQRKVYLFWHLLEEFKKKPVEYWIILKLWKSKTSMKKVALIQRPGQTQTKRPVTCEWLLVSFVCLGAIIQVSFTMHKFYWNNTHTRAYTGYMILEFLARDINLITTKLT